MMNRFIGFSVLAKMAHKGTCAVFEGGKEDDAPSSLGRAVGGRCWSLK